MPCIAFGAALPTRCECISASLAIWVWLDATAPLPALRHSDKMVTQDADREGDEQDAQLARQRQVADQRQAQVSSCAAAAAAAAAARCLRPAELAEPLRGVVGRIRQAAAGGQRRRRAARRGIMPTPNCGVGRRQHGALPSSLSLGKNSSRVWMRIPCQLQS